MNCNCSLIIGPNCLLKAKFHYASWFEAGRRQVRCWSPTSFEPVCDQLRTSLEPASVTEFGFYCHLHQYRYDRDVVPAIRSVVYSTSRSWHGRASAPWDAYSSSVLSQQSWPKRVAAAACCGRYYGIGQAIIFLSCDFYFFFFLSFFPGLVSAAADRISTILPHMVWP